ncbi:hypothetical protein [Streptomyces sp. 891-h]|uniref:hypothetical protein n=1 Tax=unclassified Streptomyces TaxID=2593676 RepID=UPI001FAA1960|nr:hypothetical protein [Streptomyces sp. 891-h]UNZ19564.1 hypothetical protein HC362_23540 [Streptomyces sp. 891-h]
MTDDDLVLAAAQLRAVEDEDELDGAPCGMCDQIHHMLALARHRQEADVAYALVIVMRRHREAKHPGPPELRLIASA